MRNFLSSISCIAATAFFSSTSAFSTRQSLTLQRQQCNIPLSLSSDDNGYEETINEAAEMLSSQQQQPPPPPQARSPPPVPPKRLDPLMASLTRNDANAAQEVPTKNVPFLGEIPVDGSVTLLIPAAGFAVIGFLLSIYIAFTSSDQIVGLVTQVSNDIANQATTQANQQYDPNVCRGICASDNEGLKNFMEGLRK